MFIVIFANILTCVNLLHITLEPNSIFKAFFFSQILFQSDTGTERVGGFDSDNVRGSLSSSLHDQHPGRHSHFQPGRYLPYTGTPLRCSEGLSHKSSLWLYPTRLLSTPQSLCL